MRRGEIKHGAKRHDAGRINPAMALVIVPFDVLEIDRVRHTGKLINLACVGREIRVVGNLVQVALEGLLLVLRRVSCERGGRERFISAMAY